MICSCRNMTLSTMIVLKLHKISLYIFFRSYFYYYSTCSFFLAIFTADESLFNFTLLYTPISLCLSGDLLYFSIYISFYFLFQCCYNLFSGTVFLWFPMLSTTSHSCLLLCTFFTVISFADDRPTYPSYIHIHQCYIWQHVLFVLYFLLCLNSHLSFISFFCGHFMIFSRMGYR